MKKAERRRRRGRGCAGSVIEFTSCGNKDDGDEEKLGPRWWTQTANEDETF